jgi:hypothetical protein
MERTLIALRGWKDSGKSTTLGIAYQELLNSYGGREIRSGRHHADSRDLRGAILEIDRVRVGFVSAGDLARILERCFDLLVREGCLVIVCAARSYGESADFVERQEPDYRVVWIEKARNAAADQDRGNRETAGEMVRAVRSAVRTAQQVEAQAPASIVLD